MRAAESAAAGGAGPSAAPLPASPEAAAAQPPPQAIVSGFACGSLLRASVASARACAELVKAEAQRPYCSYSASAANCFACSAAEFAMRMGAAGYDIYATRESADADVAPSSPGLPAPPRGRDGGTAAAGGGALQLGALALASLLVPAVALTAQHTRGDDHRADASYVGSVMVSPTAGGARVRRVAAMRVCTVALVAAAAWTLLGFSLAFSSAELLDGVLGRPVLPLHLGSLMLAGAGQGGCLYALSLLRAVAMAVGLASCGVVRHTWASPLPLALVLSSWLLIGVCPPMHWIWSAHGGLRVRGAFDVSGALVSYVTAASGLCVVARARAARSATSAHGGLEDDEMVLDLDIDGRSSLCNTSSIFVAGARRRLRAPQRPLHVQLAPFGLLLQGELCRWLPPRPPCGFPCAPCRLFSPLGSAALPSTAVLFALGVVGLHASSALLYGGSATRALVATAVSVRACRAKGAATCWDALCEGRRGRVCAPAAKPQRMP